MAPFVSGSASTAGRNLLRTRLPGECDDRPHAPAGLAQLPRCQPGVLDKSTQGWPGKYSLCFAEDEESSPWEPLSRGARIPARPVDGDRVRRGVRPQRARPRHVRPRATAGPVRRRHGRSRQPEPRPLCHRARARARRASEAGGMEPRSHAGLALRARLAVPRRSQARGEGRAGVLHQSPAARVALPSTPMAGSPDPCRRTRTTLGGVGPRDEAVRVHRGLGPEDILLCVGGGQAGGHSAFFPSWSRGRSVPFVTKEVPFMMRILDPTIRVTGISAAAQLRSSAVASRRRHRRLARERQVQWHGAPRSHRRAAARTPGHR